jgi:tRNA(fMet)-specific endonuclease VapC
MRHLDMNVVIAYLNGNVTVATRIKDYLPGVGIGSLVLAELLYGARASMRVSENVERVKQLLQVVSVADFDQSCAETYSQVRFALRKIGRPTGEMDMLIAATAMVHGATLVTHNSKHFKHIEGLSLEDWLV